MMNRIIFILWAFLLCPDRGSSSPFPAQSFRDVQQLYLADPFGHLSYAKEQLASVSPDFEMRRWSWFVWYVAMYESEQQNSGVAGLVDKLEQSLAAARQNAWEEELTCLSLVRIYLVLESVDKNEERIVQAYEDLLAEAASLQRFDLQAFVLAEYAGSLFVIGKDAKASDIMTSVLDTLEKRADAIAPIYMVRIKARTFFSFFYQRQKDLAIAAGAEVEELSRAMNLSYFRMISLVNTATAIVKMGEKNELEKAVNYYRTALELALDLKLPMEVAHVLSSLTAAYTLQGNHIKAIEVGRKAIEIQARNNITSQEWIGNTYNMLARSELEARQYEEAIEHAEVARRAYPSSMFKELAETSHIKFKAYLALGKKDEALASLMDYVARSEEGMQQIQSEEFNKASAKLGLQVIKAENAVKTQQIKETEKMRVVLIALLLLSAIIISLMLISMRGHRIIRENREKMQTLLDNIDEGILTISKNLEVERQRSGPLSQLMLSLNGPARIKHIGDLLRYFNLSEEDRSMINEALASILGEDMISWDMNSHIFPHALTAGSAPSLRHFTFHWVPIRHENQVHKVLLSIRETTGYNDLQRLVNLEKSRNETLTVAMEEFFQAGVARAAEIIERVGAMARELEDLDADRRQGFLRELHSIKGLARANGMRQISQRCHELESTLLNDAAPKTSAAADFRSVVAIYEEVETRFRSVALQASCLPVKSLQGIVQSLLPAALTRIQDEDLHVQEIRVLDDVLDWQPEHLPLVTEMLMHSLNNSLDHGFIFPKQKGREVRPVSLLFHAGITHGMLNVTVRDNGVGLDVEALKELAARRHMPLDNPNAWTDIVFDDGITTAGKTTETSGRGIGLAAIRSLCRQNGGDAVIFANTDGPGTSLRLTLPYRDAHTVDSRSA